MGMKETGRVSYEIAKLVDGPMCKVSCYKLKIQVFPRLLTLCKSKRGHSDFSPPNEKNKLWHSVMIIGLGFSER